MDEIRFGILVAAVCAVCTRPTTQCACGFHEPHALRPFGIHA